LLRLKRRVVLAYRGHSLLKDKQDELVRRFLPLIEETWALRKEIGEELTGLLKRLILVEGLVGKKLFRQAIMVPPGQISLQVSDVRLLNLRLPQYAVQIGGKGLVGYSLVKFPQELDEVLVSYQKLMVRLIKLAQLEKTIWSVGEEIERTRRRVNALEHILIPNLLETIKYIEMKLSERERESLVRLMKIKEIIRAH